MRRMRMRRMRRMNMNETVRRNVKHDPVMKLMDAIV